MYAYKRGLHIIQNNKNDACFCSFWTIWQLFWAFFIYLRGGGCIYQYQRTDSDTDLILIYCASHHFQQYCSYIMATSFSGGRSRSTRIHHFCKLQRQARTDAVLVVIGLYELLGHPTTYLVESPGHWLWYWKKNKWRSRQTF